jgi:hypothetical protein
MCILDRTQGDMSSLKKPAKCVQYVHRLERICLLVYFPCIRFSPGGGTFLDMYMNLCTYIIHNKVDINKIYMYKVYMSQITVPIYRNKSPQNVS